MSDHVLSLMFMQLCVFLFFFFFQAEDGIRDTSVTGVQTCALPISAAYLASRQASASAWLVVWLVEAFVAVAIAAPAAATKAHRANSRLFSGPGRKFVLSFAPPIVVGALLTYTLLQAGALPALPGLWPLLYGTAIMTAGAFSVRVVPVMGWCLMLLGTAALFVPGGWGDAFMAAGFGIVHVGFGWWIARHYGG